MNFPGLINLPAFSSNGILNVIEHFFVSYDQVEKKQFKLIKRGGPVAALKLIKTGQRAYASQSTKE